MLNDTVEEHMGRNEANWDARTPIHVASRFYGINDGRTADSWFGPFEWEAMGEPRDLDVLHLQCHLGTETIAFAQRGARATGLDISGRSIHQAQLLAEKHGVKIDYIHANVYDAVEALQGKTYDLVYTGKGALCYLPDLPAWASIVSQLLRPGGRCYIVEFHPMLNSLSPKPAPDDDDTLLLRHDYLEGRGAIEHDSTHTYTDGPALGDNTTSYEWAHGLGEVITSLIGAGLRIDDLHETNQLPWPRWNRMKHDPTTGWWELPPTEPRLPLLYALTASKHQYT